MPALLKAQSRTAEGLDGLGDDRIHILGFGNVGLDEDSFRSTSFTMRSVHSRLFHYIGEHQPGAFAGEDFGGRATYARASTQ